MESRNGCRVTLGHSAPALNRIPSRSACPPPSDSQPAWVVCEYFEPNAVARYFNGAFHQEYPGFRDFFRLGEIVRLPNSLLYTSAPHSLPRFQTPVSVKFRPCLKAPTCRCFKLQATAWAVYSPFVASPLVYCRCSTQQERCLEMRWGGGTLLIRLVRCLLW